MWGTVSSFGLRGGGPEPRHMRGGGGWSLCPRGRRKAQGLIPRKGALSPPDPSPAPT